MYKVFVNFCLSVSFVLLLLISGWVGAVFRCVCGVGGSVYGCGRVKTKSLPRNIPLF